ncbi:MAG: hypothetical protein K6U04_13305 [Armatimonadetes bacterium]|nr:hypothetical protein [Armatimonadota bacterium]
MKRWPKTATTIIAVLAVTGGAIWFTCAINSGKNKVEGLKVPSKTTSQISQQIQAPSNTQTQAPTEKKLTQVIVKRGNDVFSFDNPLGLRGLGIISDIQDLLWVAPRGGAGIQPEVEQVESKELDKVLENGDKMKDAFCSVRLIYEPYRPEQGMNDLAHKDLIIYTDPGNVNDACLGVQKPDNQTEWDLYRLPDYGQWLKKEVDLLLRLRTGL